jgi:hypothetical protein
MDGFISLQVKAGGMAIRQQFQQHGTRLGIGLDLAMLAPALDARLTAYHILHRMFRDHSQPSGEFRIGISLKLSNVAKRFDKGLLENVVGVEQTVGDRRKFVRNKLKRRSRVNHEQSLQGDTVTALCVRQ